MDDIKYELTEWFPAKIKPVRNGVYNTKTKDGYTYQAVWTGKDWEQTWGEPPKKIKIKEWQGIPYNPDGEEPKNIADAFNIIFENNAFEDAISELEKTVESLNKEVKK